MKRLISISIIILFTGLNVFAEKSISKFKDHRTPENSEPSTTITASAPSKEAEMFSPAEFNRAHGVFLGWSEYQKVELKDIAYEVSKTDTVYVVHMQGEDSICKKYFTENKVNMNNVKFFNADTNEVSVWIRDYGPFYVYEDGNRALVQYDYKNYPTNPIPGLLAEAWGFKYYYASLKYSGGNFMCDGNGMGFVADILLEENLLIGKEDSIARNFKKYLGVDSVVFVKSMKKDGTGHIDMAQKLLNDTLIIVGEYLNASDAYGQNKSILDQNAEKLSKIKNLDGRSFNVVRIPMPPIYYNGTKPVTSSYTNSLIVNNKVLVPIYGDTLAHLDTIALNIYKKLMPDYEVVGINSAEVIKSNGAVHCITNTHFHKNPLKIFHSHFDTVEIGKEPVIDFRLNPRFKTMSGSVYYKSDSKKEYTEVKATLKNGIFSATLPKMSENFKYYFKGAASSGGGEFTVNLPEDAPVNAFSVVAVPTSIKNKMLANTTLQFSHYPNPFKDKTILAYTVNKNSSVTLVIYNLSGQKICSLVDGFQSAGSYKTTWNGTDKIGEHVSSGIYYSVLTIGSNGQDVVKMKNKVFLVR